MTISVPQDLTRPGVAELAMPTRVRWTYVAPTLLTFWIISMLDKSNISLVIADPQFLGEMQLGGETKLLGWLAGSMFISYSLAAPLWGWAVMRYGPRHAIMASLAIWALTCFWSAVSQSYGMLLASRIGLGIGEAACYPVTLALVANWFALRERGKATAYWWIGTMIGPMLTGVIVTGLIVATGWRGQFWAMGLLALALPLPMIWFLVRDKPEQHPAVNAAEIKVAQSGAIEQNNDAPGRILKGVSSVWRNYRFWLMVLAISCNAIFFWGWSIWLPTYLRTARHFAFSTSGYLTFVIYGFAVATILVIGHVRRSRLGIGRGVPDGRGACALDDMERHPDDLCAMRAASRHIVRRNADAQCYRHGRHGQVARRARTLDANDGRAVAGDDRLHPRLFGGRLSGAVRGALGGRRDLRRLHDRTHQRRILKWQYQK
jgi:MFS family permease